MAIRIRSAVAGDAEACAKIMFDAFTEIAAKAGFASELTLPYSTERATRLLNHPEIFGAIAESDGVVVGLCFLDERNPIRGAGPLAVSPAAQGKGVGRRLMEVVVSRVAGYPGVRLMQDAFNLASLSLFTSLGFDPKESVVMMRGQMKDTLTYGSNVRPMTETDLEACEQLCLAVHGFERTSELRDALAGLAPFVAVRDGGITSYATTVQSFRSCHAVAETVRDMQAVLAGAAQANGGHAEFLLPVRQAEFFRWALSQGMRTERPLTLMARGEYQDPRGCFVPSVIY